MTHSALKAVVESDCIQRVGGAECFNEQCVHRNEDATLGICMKRMSVPLWQCLCFHPNGPCDVFNPSTCEGRLCERPLSMHKLRSAKYYDAWWDYVTKPAEIQHGKIKLTFGHAFGLPFRSGG